MSGFRMPALGADMTEGTVTEWLVHPGDHIDRGDVVAVVDTDKSAIEVECFTSGTVERLLVEEGTRVPVGTVLAVIADESASETAVPEPPELPEVPEPAPAGPPPAHRPYLPPLVRRLAAQHGVDPTALTGTGPGGQITVADVERAAASASPPAPVPTPAPPVRADAHRPRVSPYARRLAAELDTELSRISPAAPGAPIRAADVRRASGAPRPRTQPRRDPRYAIAELMSRSWREIPHYHLATTIDLSTALDWLHRRNLDRPVTQRLVPGALLLKAAALSAREVPELNGSWAEGRFTPASGVHLGVAVSLRGGGLLAPVIHDAADLTVDQLMQTLSDLVDRARRGRLRGSETTGASLTVTSLGDHGAESVFGIIHPPQVALVGFGRVTERPVAAEGRVEARPTVIATLSADHRASDGATGSRYLTRLDRLLQDPDQL